MAKGKLYRVRSESPDGENFRVTDLRAADEDEARFNVEKSNRELAQDAGGTPSDHLYKITGVEEL